MEHVQKQLLVLIQEWGVARPSEVFLKIYSYGLWSHGLVLNYNDKAHKIIPKSDSRVTL